MSLVKKKGGLAVRFGDIGGQGAKGGQIDEVCTFVRGAMKSLLLWSRMGCRPVCGWVEEGLWSAQADGAPAVTGDVGCRGWGRACCKRLPWSSHPSIVEHPRAVAGWLHSLVTYISDCIAAARHRVLSIIHSAHGRVHVCRVELARSSPGLHRPHLLREVHGLVVLHRAVRVLQAQPRLIHRAIE
jgi:hypothetical protein